MDLARKTSSAVGIGDAGITRVGRSRYVAGAMAAIAITMIFITALLVVSRGTAGPATQVDQLTGPAAIEFRAAERGLTGTQPDPLVEFRAGERRLIGTQPDPLVEFRAGERVGAAQ